tara:strand:- start:257 stop:1027 length:771 start_codon:yes stop_codon:yes gene_type:complete
MIVTNECRRTPGVIKQELLDMGIDIAETPILTSGIMTYNYIFDIINMKENINTIFNVFTIGEDGLLEVLEELSFLPNYKKITESFIERALKKNKVFKDCDRYVNYMIIGSINNIDIKLISLINNYFKVFSNVKVIITCPDEIDPEGDNIIVPKHLIHILNYNKTEEILPYYTGKPNPLIAKYIKNYFKEKFGTEKDADTVFVGDTLETDIKLANEALFKSVLVLSGNTKQEDLKKSLITPDYVIDSVDDLFTVIDR